MARYDVRTAALALDVPYDSLDVILARHDVPGVVKASQGVKRTVDDGALVILRLAFDLRDGLGLPFERAVATAQRLATQGSASAGEITLSADLPALRSGLALRVSDAVERSVPVRRGRPPAAPDRRG